MKTLLKFLLCTFSTIMVFSCTAIAAEPDKTPSIPTDGDVWDGETVTAPTILVQNNGVTYYQINTCAELAYIAENQGDWLTYNYILNNNLILNDVVLTWSDDGICTNEESLNEWTPIGSSSAKFTGIFDGNGFTVSGLYINDSDASYVGLFGYAQNATLTNLSIVNSFVFGNSYVGSLVGNLNNSWDDSVHTLAYCQFSGFIRAYTSYAGGIVGSSGGKAAYLKNFGTVCASSVAGGISGSGPYSLKNSSNYGKVFYLQGSSSDGLKGNRFGGLTGYGDYCIDCVNYGTVTGLSRVGGIYGYSGGGTYEVENCENRGTISGEYMVGGISGYSIEERISSCKNSGIVRGETCVGGIVGYRTCEWYPATFNIQNSYNIGSIYGEDTVGGIVGGIATGSYVINCYNIGTVEATGIAGAIFCSDDFIWGKTTATNCFYDKSITPNLFGCGFEGVNGDYGGIQGMTSAQLKNLDTYPKYDYPDNPDGWDFEEDYGDWKIGGYNNGYPYLSWESTDEVISLTGISLLSQRWNLSMGDTCRLSVRPLPITADLPALTWKSSDESVVTVKNGIVSAVGIGSATIKVTGGKYSDSCTITVSARAANEYRLGTISISSGTGIDLNEIPSSNFWVTIPITKLVEGGNTQIFLAAYDRNGRYEGLLSVSVEELAINSTVKITLPVKNQTGSIAQLKAFSIPSLSYPVPLGNTAVFPVNSAE